MKKYAQVQKGGFTLVELLVVIAIVAILAAIIVLIINPLELTRRGRDAARLTDLANLQTAINVAVQEATQAASDFSVACNTTPKTATCLDRSSAGGAGIRATDGSGWIKVNLALQSSVSVPTLPIDPSNSPGSTGLHYTYCGGGDNWLIITDLESTQQQPKRGADGGTEPLKYEVGSTLNRALVGGASCVY